MGCEKVAFLNVYSGEDCQNIDENGEMYYDTNYNVYPEEPVKTAKRIVIEAESFKHVPTFINQVYNEVIGSYNNQSTLLPAAGLRTIVEAICKDVNVEKGHIYNDDNEIIMKDGEPVLSGSLKGKINGLQEAGIITNPQKNVLHQVRKLGNYAVHEIAFPKLRTIRMGIEVIENILTNIYELDKFSLGIK